ncbi:MAG TPA: ABC-type transport auxiliary lipoprotein family protein [Stellaceae bacterium]|jgi:cholesterol transport system auxiliary component|nr:ABC-type transport auxiliary lipoprotein family protein [Stellaceae bacterium]
MTRPASRVARRWLAGAAALALAGCASLFVATPPGNLYRLAAANDFPSNLPDVGAQMLVDLPEAPAAIDTNRIALSKSPLSLDYYADSVWTDRVPDVLENLLVASFEDSRAITAIGRGSSGLRADFILRTEIRHFEAVYDAAGGPPRVWVAIIARLVAMPQRRIIAQARFEQRAPAAADNVPAVVAAFNTATDAALRAIVLWTLGNPALSRTQR